MKPCQHDAREPGCAVCALYAADPRYRALWDGTPPPATPTARPLPCVHEGPVLESCKSCSGARAEGRHVRDCGLHDRCTRVTVGPAVRGCDRCHDFDAGLPRWRPVPPPVLSPARDRLVLTAVMGDDAEAIHACTGPTHRRYAEAVGAEYVVLRDRTQDSRVPCAEKWRVGGYVPHYPGGTLWLDADVFVLPDAPDVFAAAPADAIGMVDVSAATPNLLAWAAGKTAELCRSQGVDPLPDDRYWNSGVWVGRPEHAAYWTPPEKPFPAEWCVEELWCRRNVAAHALPVRDLDPRFDWTWPTDRGFRSWKAARPWFAHLAGMGNMDVPGWTQSNREWRQALLRLLAAVAGPAD